MTGIAWVTSYLVLCFTVLVLLFALAGLYRERSAREAETGGLAWPLKPGPGTRLDDVLDHPLPGVALPSGTTENGVFIVFADADEDAFPAVMSVDVVARAWSREVQVLVRQDVPMDDAPDWTSALSESLQRSVVRVNPALYRQLGIRRTPVVLYLRDGVATEALAGHTSPQHLSSHFRLAAEPLFEPTV